MKHESGWKKKSKEEIASIFEFSEGYKRFLDQAKTEREAVCVIQNVLSSCGFSGDWLGGKTRCINRGKELIAFVKGMQSPADGFNIVVAHVDEQRLDLKQNPLYEDFFH
jgi:aspartyl aminopeptidase